MRRWEKVLLLSVGTAFLAIWLVLFWPFRSKLTPEEQAEIASRPMPINAQIRADSIRRREEIVEAVRPLVEQCRRDRVCWTIRVQPGEWIDVEVAPAFYALTFQEKTTIALAFRAYEGLGENGMVFFLDQYTGKRVAQLTALGFSMK